MLNFDFLLERRLKELNRELARRHTCCMSLFEEMLKNFLAVFPKFTDHTLLHTLNVVNISNQIIRDNIEKLNASEIYIYLMSCALHDIGMGISDRDLDQFIDSAGVRGYIEDHPEMSKPDMIRRFHHDLSAQFVKKYWDIFDVPSVRYAEAIAAVSRGHRKIDLMDTELYPTDFDLGDGNRANLALLAALLRLCDELDVASDRNPDLLYDIKKMEEMKDGDIFEFYKHEAIRPVEFTEDSVVIIADTEREDVAVGIINATKIVKETLMYSFSVIEARSDFKIDCQKVRLILNEKEVKI